MHLNTTWPVPEGSKDYGVRGTAWKPIVWAALACTVATLAIALSPITLHLHRYRAPQEQRQIVRITFSVIVHAVVAFFEVYSYEAAHALYLLFIQYAAPSVTLNDSLFTAVKEAEEVGGIDFGCPRISWIFVFQYPIVKVVCVAIIEATDRYCTKSLDPWFGHLWIEIIQSIGIGASVIAIWKFRGNMKQLIKVRRGLAMLGCFKIIVFIRFTQAWVFGLLLQYKVVKPSAMFSYSDVLWGVPGLATCAEMGPFSLGFWYAFSSTEYGSNAKPRETPLPLGKAVFHALNPWDPIVGIARIFPLWGGVHRNGDWKEWRAARAEAGLVGAIKRSVRKYKSRQGGETNGRYQDVGKGLEELKMPMQSHHSRSGSAATQQSATDYALTTGLGGQQLYQPPSGSPDEASSYLMPNASPRPSSQGQWNGQRYDRTSSPAGRFSMDTTAGRETVRRFRREGVEINSHGWLPWRV